MSSKVVKEKVSSKSSNLIKAMKGWDSNKFFTDVPKGSFGSKATIKCNGATIKSSELDLEFDIPFDDDMEPNEAEIIIYNLSNTTNSRLARGKKITVEAGFTGDTGVIFTGYIDKKTTKFDGVDRKTTLNCVDRMKTKKIKKEITFKKGTKASSILKKLINMTGTPIAVFKIKRDYKYKDEQKVDGDLMENIKKYSEVCGISVYVNKGKVYARSLKVGDALNFTVEESTGLIGSPTEYEEEITAEKYKDKIKGYEIETILQHRFTTGGIINLKSRDVKGKFRIRSGKHVFNSGEAKSTIKVY